MRTLEIDKTLVDTYVKDLLSARELYIKFRWTGVTWREVRDVLRESGLMRKQGVTVRGRHFDPIPCRGCDAAFTPESSRQYHCQDCQPDHKLNRTLQNAYRIPRERYDELLALQNHACGICGVSFSEIKERPTKDGRPRRETRIDHDHKTGDVRGLLCNRCNTRLAGLEDETWHRLAMLYLEKSRGISAHSEPLSS